jgi:hypothetical protein
MLFIIVFWLADYLQTHAPEMVQDSQQSLESGQNRGAGGDLGESPVFTPDPPSWLTLTTILVGSLLAAVIIVAIIWRLRQLATPPSATALEQLAEEAQNAMVALESGGDVSQTILRCYREMSRVLKQEKGIARESTMTPREFERRLIEWGLPQDSVRTLTRLFEQVRYGHIDAAAPEKDLALACLNDIVQGSKLIEDGRE